MNAALFFLLVSSSSLGGWGPSGCSGPVGPVSPLLLSLPPTSTHKSPSSSGLEWWVHHGHERYLFLYHGSHIVGRWDHERSEYRPNVRGFYGDPDGAPIPLPASWHKQPPPAQGAVYFGVERPAAASQDRHIMNGVEIPKPDPKEVFKETVEGPFPDDLNKPHLSLFCRDAETKRKLEATVSLEVVKEKLTGFRVQIYNVTSKPERAMCEVFRLDQDERFKAAAVAGVLQAPSKEGKGKVIESFYFQDAGEDAAGWLRKVDPNYDPNKLRPVNPLRRGKQTSWLAVLSAAFLGLHFLGKR